MLDQLELAFAICGVAAVLYAAFDIGRFVERRSRRKSRPQQRKETSPTVLKFKTPGEAGLALAEELNKRKPDPDRIDAIAKAQNALRRVA